MHPARGFSSGCTATRTVRAMSSDRRGLAQTVSPSKCETPKELERWVSHLDSVEVDHAPICDLGHSRFISLQDPDGIQFEAWLTLILTHRLRVDRQRKRALATSRRYRSFLAGTEVARRLSASVRRGGDPARAYFLAFLKPVIGTRTTEAAPYRQVGHHRHDRGQACGQPSDFGRRADRHL
jgi:hypothetical protein